MGIIRGFSKVSALLSVFYGLCCCCSLDFTELKLSWLEYKSMNNREQRFDPTKLTRGAVAEP